LRCGVYSSGLKVQGLGFRIYNSWGFILGYGFWVQGSGGRVRGIGFRVSSLWCFSGDKLSGVGSFGEIPKDLEACVPKFWRRAARHQCLVICYRCRTWTPGHLDTWAPGHLDTWTLGPLNTWTPGHVEIRTPGRRMQFLFGPRLLPHLVPARPLLPTTT